MANKELVDYLLSIQQYNCSQETITKVLINAGWADQEIQDAFNVVYGLEQTPSYAWLKAGTVVVLLMMALVFGVGSNLSNNITGNVVGVREEATINLAQTEPELADYQITVMEEVDVPASEAEVQEAIEEQVQEETMPTLDECEKMMNSVRRDECMGQYALKLNDKELCKRIGNTEKHFNCIQQIAIKTKEPELCHTLSNSPGCLTEYALQTGDKTACKGIPNDAHRQACLGNS